MRARLNRIGFWLLIICLYLVACSLFLATGCGHAVSPTSSTTTTATVTSTSTTGTETTTTTDTETTTTGTGTTTTGTGTTTTGTGTTTTGTITTTSFTSTTTGINQVATPTFTLSSGSYEANSLYVTIECDTAGANIYFTLNGDTPTSGSTPYTHSFSIEASKVVKAIGIKSGKTDSYIGSSWYDLYWWQAMGNEIEGQVNAIALGESGSFICLAGSDLIYLGGYHTDNVAQWNGDRWVGKGLIGYDVGYQLYTLAIPTGETLYAGGFFDYLGNTHYLMKWNGTTWEGVGEDPSEDVYSSAYDSSRNLLYVGGIFDSAGGIPANKIAKWNGVTWEALGSGMATDTPPAMVYALTYDSKNNVLYAGGSFTTAGGVTVNNIAKWNGTSWTALGNGVNGAVNSLSYDSIHEVLYVGGNFTTAGGNPANRIAKWDGSSWSALGGGVNNSVNAISYDANHNIFYIGGSFTSAETNSVNYIAKYDGSAWSTVGNGMNDHGTVRSLQYDEINNVLYCGGSFTAAGGITANRIAKWARKN